MLGTHDKPRGAARTSRPAPGRGARAATAVRGRDQERAQAAALLNAGRLDEAEAIYQALLGKDPRDGAAAYHLALILHARNRLADALALADRSIARVPGFAPLWYLRGLVLRSQGHDERALESYAHALRLQPGYVDALLNSGVVLHALQRHAEALHRFQQVLRLDPQHARALGNAASLLQETNQEEAALAMTRRLLRVDRHAPNGLGMLADLQLRLCDWEGLPALGDEILAAIRAGRGVCRTLRLMALPSTARDQQRAAEATASRYFPAAAQPLWRGEAYRHDRIRLAYVSPDFREHPVSHLMCGIFERHDRSRFETIAISIGPDDGSPMRKRVEGAFERWIDMAGQGSLRIAERIRELEVDILVDLAGYTGHGRPDIYAHRAAPIQVGYLGYPGTMGTPYHDAILADRCVIPPEHRGCYSEEVVYLPGSYLPAAAGQAISPHTPSRAECGLPASGAVLCAFSHPFKINPAIFDVWMRLLQQIPGAVLWLAASDGPPRANLKREALLRGVDPQRLVFADRLPRAEDHLARYRLADLFLDTAPYNAHTTAADALLAGLPVVTCLGDSFPARVAASLLQAAGLPELVTHSMADYEALVLRLIQEPALLQQTKARLQANHRTQPLFDSDGFCRHLEAAYAGLHERATLRAHPQAVLSPGSSAAAVGPDVTEDPDRALAADVQSALAAAASQPRDVAALMQLAAVRTRLGLALVAMDAEGFAARWPGALERVHAQLIGRGISQVAPAAADEPVLAAIRQYLQRAHGAADAHHLLAASMLYIGPHLQRARSWLTNEPLALQAVWRAYLFKPPGSFRMPGETEIYAAWYTGLLREIAAGLEARRDDPHWIGVALAFVNTASTVPLYFADSALVEAMTLRARIVEALMDNVTGSPGRDHRFARRSGGRIRLGILAAHFGPQTETWATLPVYSHLDRTRFEVVLISQVGFRGQPPEAHCLSLADAPLSLSGQLAQDVRSIRALALDALWIGTNLTATSNYTVQLAAHRLAPLQMTGGCSSVTTGLQHVDVFVSGQATERDDAQSHYTERLRLVPGPAHCFEMGSAAAPAALAAPRPRAEFGVGAGDTLYVSGANFFKMIPELLAAWVEIVARTPGSRLLLYPFNPNWTSDYPVANFFLELGRHAAARGVALDRFVVLAPLPDRAAVLNLLRAADLYLDSFPYSGMTSLLDPLEVGLPIVAMDGHFQRQRMAASALRTLGLGDWLVDAPADYVARAVALGQDGARRAAMRQALAAAMAVTPKFLDPKAYSDAVAEIIVSELKAMGRV